MARSNSRKPLGDLAREHEALKQELAQARKQEEYWRGLRGEHDFQEWLGKQEVRINELRDTLETAKSSEVARLQGELRALKNILSGIDALADGHGVEVVKRKLADFEDRNALLLPPHAAEGDDE